MGWGLLNDVLKTAWMLGFSIYIVDLFPRLFPRFTFDTPQLYPVYQSGNMA